MNPLLRRTLAVILGVVLGSVVNMALVMISPLVIPPPAGVNVNDPESLRASMHLFEPRHFLFPFLAHALGTLAGAIAAGWVAGAARKLAAGIVGGFFLLGGIAACFMIPAPKWFMAADLMLAYLPMAWLGQAWVGHLRPDAVAR